jgi:hypothetical protein
MSKMSKKKNDITFIDPVTMQVRCTFNQCVDKFTVEGTEIQKLPNGNEFVSGYHECSECGQRVKARGDSKRAVNLHRDRVLSGENEFYNAPREPYVDPYKAAMEKFKAKKAASKDKQ